jgi:hypothetical protein
MTSFVHSVGRVECWSREGGIRSQATAPIGSLNRIAATDEGATIIEWLRDVDPQSTPVLGVTPSKLDNVLNTSCLVWRHENENDPFSGVVLIRDASPMVGVLQEESEGPLGGIGNSTSVLPGRGIHHLLQAASNLVESTVADRIGGITFVREDGLAATLEIAKVPDWHDSPAINRRAAEASAAVGDLVAWLHRTRDEVAEICGFSVRASHYWVVGKAPRPSTVRRLIELHAFVGSLVGQMGTSRARAWLNGPGVDGQARVDVLRDPEGLTDIVREAAPILFGARRTRERPRPLTLEVEDDVAAAGEFKYRDLADKVRRPRKPPRS